MKRDTHEQLQRYAKYRIPTGGFLHAVLSNDLFEALNRADEDNRADIYEISQFVHHNLPIGSYGSVKNVKAWLAGRHKV